MNIDWDKLLELTAWLIIWGAIVWLVISIVLFAISEYKNYKSAKQRQKNKALRDLEITKIKAEEIAFRAEKRKAEEDRRDEVLRTTLAKGYLADALTDAIQTVVPWPITDGERVKLGLKTMTVARAIHTLNDVTSSKPRD